MLKVRREFSLPLGVHSSGNAPHHYHARCQSNQRLPQPCFKSNKLSITFQFQFTMTYTISLGQQSFFDEKGYLILRDVMSLKEAIALQHWAQEVHHLPRTAETPWMPYEEINASGKRVLCRTENYANYHPQFNALLRGPKLLSILGQLAREDMLLFKEKSE
jgi:hypothetical protein